MTAISVFRGSVESDGRDHPQLRADTWRSICGLRDHDQGISMTNKSDSGFATLIVGAIVGAAAMYLLDPDKGKRRRAIARDKLRSIAAQSTEFAGKATRDFSHRMQGVRAQVRRPSRDQAPPDDLVLIERARSRMGRVVSHPHAIQIGANGGRITLSGPILADEVDALLDAIRSVPGVSSVDNHLDIHEHAESVPSLQGAGRRDVQSTPLQPMRKPAYAVAAAAVAGAAALAFVSKHARGAANGTRKNR
jgi:hypothetical protein